MLDIFLYIYQILKPLLHNFKRASAHGARSPQLGPLF